MVSISQIISLRGLAYSARSQSPQECSASTLGGDIVWTPTYHLTKASDDNGLTTQGDATLLGNKFHQENAPRYQINIDEAHTKSAHESLQLGTGDHHLSQQIRPTFYISWAPVVPYTLVHIQLCDDENPIMSLLEPFAFGHPAYDNNPKNRNPSEARHTLWLDRDSFK